MSGLALAGAIVSESPPPQLCTVCCLFTALLNTVLVATVAPQDPPPPGGRNAVTTSDYPSVSARLVDFEILVIGLVNFVFVGGLCPLMQIYAINT